MHIQTKLDLAAHCSITVISTVFLYSKYHNPLYVGVFIAGCIFIDLDHLIDYFLHYKERFCLSRFVNHGYLASGKVYVFLHAWELVMALTAVAVVAHSRILGILAISLAIHLTIDNVQRRRPFFYFITYRISKKFDAVFLLPEYYELKNAGGAMR